MTVLITEEETRGLLSLTGAIPVVEEMFRMAGQGGAVNSERFEMPAGDGYLLFRAAAMQGASRVGFKLLSSFGTGPRQMWNFLYDVESGALLAIVQSRAISRLRTAAASAVAARHLSPEGAATLGMFGAGKQAETQLEAICAVRPVTTVRVWSRTPEPLRAFCARMAERLGIDVAPAARPEEAARAEIVVTVTNTETPVLLGDWIDGARLLIAVGANEWYERELDPEAVARATMVVVDDLRDAQSHCGDLLYAAAKDRFDWERAVTLGAVVAGTVSPPDFAQGFVLFESQGIALEDVAVTSAVYDAAVARGLGSDIRL